MLTFLIGAYCVWIDATTLVVYLGCGATIQPHRDVLIIKASLTSADGRNSLAKTLQLLPPRIPPTPLVLVEASAFPSVCAALQVDGTDLLGSGGRDTVYAWDVTDSDLSEDPHLPEIRNLLQSQTSSVLTIAQPEVFALFQTGGAYTMNLAATNYFNQTSTIEFDVSICDLVLLVIKELKSFAGEYVYQKCPECECSPLGDYSCSLHCFETAR
jgi:hypothetical protein